MHRPHSIHLSLFIDEFLFLPFKTIASKGHAFWQIVFPSIKLHPLHSSIFETALFETLYVFKASVKSFEKFSVYFKSTPQRDDIIFASLFLSVSLSDNISFTLSSSFP